MREKGVKRERERIRNKDSKYRDSQNDRNQTFFVVVERNRNRQADERIDRQADGSR